MAEIVNLRRARKDKARAEKDVRAAGNRAHFGRGKTEKRATEAKRGRAESVLDGKKLDSHPGSDAPPGRKT
jgi:hypothetical protein